MAEQTAEVKFLHHHQARETVKGERKVTDYSPGEKATFPAETARALVRDKLAEFTSKKAEAAAGAPAPVEQ